MISLRQHAISLVAVFLALTLGLFLGSGFVGDRVNSLTGTSRDRLGDLQQERDALNDKVNAANSFDTAITPRLIAGQLKGASVVVVTTPNAADTDVTAVKEAIATAGASFSGQLGLTDTLVRDDNAEKLSTIIDQTIPPGATLRAELTDSGSRLGDLLGTLITHRSGGTAATAGDRQTGLQALRDGGFVTYADNAIRPADLVVVVSGAGLPANSGAQGQLVAKLASTMTARAQGGELVGRTGSSAGGAPIAVVRADPSLRNALTTVDNVEQQTGVITTVLALAAEADGRSGAYGTGAGATAITVGVATQEGQPSS